MPEITNVTDSPDTVGFGFNIIIDADITDTLSGIDIVKVNITYPDDSFITSLAIDGIMLIPINKTIIATAKTSLTIILPSHFHRYVIRFSCGMPIEVNPRNYEFSQYHFSKNRIKKQSGSIPIVFLPIISIPIRE